MLSSVILSIVLFSCAFGADPRCPREENLAVAVHLPHPTDCGKFLTCNWGDTVVQDCPGGLHWNDRYRYCDWPAQANCMSGEEEEGSALCVPGDLEPHSECSKFYICANGKRLELSCAPGLHFNPDAKVCDYPKRANCEQLSTESTSPAPTTGLSGGDEVTEDITDTTPGLPETTATEPVMESEPPSTPNLSSPTSYEFVRSHDTVEEYTTDSQHDVYSNYLYDK
ncbi:peritrophin-1-like [Toxorhynchites rutilus septentrionalis]|uniref:peritrophin-1-like n=1 Tax=Toxorhynchites rutilus septentrionalis TaxID=329112 RepID=UPI00247921EA|nr:peritrophin-1-like [Toxorhynchites rutilus septentrionalis]